MKTKSKITKNLTLKVSWTLSQFLRFSDLDQLLFSKIFILKKLISPHLFIYPVKEVGHISVDSGLVSESTSITPASVPNQPP